MNPNVKVYWSHDGVYRYKVVIPLVHYLIAMANDYTFTLNGFYYLHAREFSVKWCFNKPTTDAWYREGDSKTEKYIRKNVLQKYGPFTAKSPLRVLIDIPIQ